MTASKSIQRDNSMASRKKPYIVACSPPLSGHTLPIIIIVANLIQRGYGVTFLAGYEFQDRIEKTGASFFGIPAFDMKGHKRRMELATTTHEKMLCSIRTFCLSSMPERKISLYTALEQVKKAHPDDEIVVLTESFFLGDHPMSLGAPLPPGYTKRPRTVNIHAMPYFLKGQDSAPLGLGIIPDKTEESRRMIAEMWASEMNPYWDLVDEHESLLRESGAVDIDRNQTVMDVALTSADITLQMCPPSLEFDISDRHPKVRLAGAVKGPSLPEGFEFPSFWPDITRGDRKVVAVTQGTVAMDYENLIIPTLMALAPRSDIVVVVILGKRGASLPADVTIPPNARVIDYLSYGAILPQASCFISNAGNGGLIQGMLYGVPMVFAGITEDKPEVAARGEYAGIAINLRTEKPTRDQIAQAVDKILGDVRYKKRVMEIRQENEDMKPMDNVERAILEV
ncbi:hypothetical protein E4U21_003552 [Claviceps maximensis]|nr:hypothetical protein E4U21_003552 [Claviceps maximensis]